MSGFTYVCVISSVDTSPTVATFFICVLLFSKLFTVTVNDNVLVCPAGTVTFSPFAKSCALLSTGIPSNIIELSLYVVPSGTSSFTVTVPGAVPSVLSNTILYVISCPAFTFSPFAGVDSLWATTCGFFISTSSDGVSFSSTFAVFCTVPSYLFVASSFTFTLKLTLAVPSVLSTFSGTVTSIPVFKSACV